MRRFAAMLVCLTGLCVWAAGCETGGLSSGGTGSTTGGTNSTGSTTTSTSGYDVLTFLGHGNGGFAAPVNDSTTSLVGGIVAADFNKDGNQDVAVSYANSNSVAVFLGAAVVSWDRPARTPPTATPPLRWSWRTSMGDTTDDLAVLNQSSTTVEDHVGSHGRRLQRQRQRWHGPLPLTIAAADFNGDGRPNLAVINNGNATLGIDINQGIATFAAAVLYTTGGAVVWAGADGSEG